MTVRLEDERRKAVFRMDEQAGLKSFGVTSQDCKEMTIYVKRGKRWVPQEDTTKMSGRDPR